MTTGHITRVNIGGQYIDVDTLEIGSYAEDTHFTFNIKTAEKELPFWAMVKGDDQKTHLAAKEGGHYISLPDGKMFHSARVVRRLHCIAMFAEPSRGTTPFRMSEQGVFLVASENSYNLSGGGIKRQEIKGCSFPVNLHFEFEDA